MIYVRFWGGNGYCGCDFKEYEKFEDDETVDLDQYAYQTAYDNAETHEDVVYGWAGPDPDEVSEEEYEEEMENYYNSIDYGYDILTEDEWYEEQGLDKPIPPSEYGVHASHCCKWHGCKYGDENCPVVLGIIEQHYPCWDCNDLLNEEEYFRSQVRKIDEIKAWKANKEKAERGEDDYCAIAHNEDL